MSLQENINLFELYIHPQKGLYIQTAWQVKFIPFLFWYSKLKTLKWSTSIFQQITSGALRLPTGASAGFSLTTALFRLLDLPEIRPRWFNSHRFVSMATQMTPPDHPEHPEKCVFFLWKSLRITKSPLQSKGWMKLVFWQVCIGPQNSLVLRGQDT